MPKFNSIDEISVIIDNISRIQDNIRFADTKAAGLVIVNTGLLGFLFGRFTLFSFADSSVAQVIALLAIWIGVILLAASTVLLLLRVIFPRGGMPRSRQVGLFDNAGVSAFEDAEAFVDAFREAPVQEIADDALALVYYLTQIDRKKFQWLKRVIYISLISWSFSVAGILLSFISSPPSV